jgi:hypothetical protein
LYRDRQDFKKGYQPITNIEKNEKCNLVADCRSIMARWRNYFSQLFNVHVVSDVIHTALHTAEPQVPELSASEVGLATEKPKSHKSPVLI